MYSTLLAVRLVNIHATHMTLQWYYFFKPVKHMLQVQDFLGFFSLAAPFGFRSSGYACHYNLASVYVCIR